MSNISHQSTSVQEPAPLRMQIPLTSVHLDHERMMDCIHCGLCLSQCPTYAEEGLEADSPRGRIYLMRALAEGRVEPTPDVVEHFDLCLGCRACETACPSGVQYGHLIEGTRAHLREHVKRPWKQRLIGGAIESTFPYPNRLDATMFPLRVLRRSGLLPFLHKIGFMRLLGRLGEMERMLPPLPPMQQRLNFPERFRARGEKQASVGMITGCVMPVMQTPVNAATARVLCKSGCDVAAPKTQVCCGALHAHSGALDEAKKLARKNIEVFETWQREHGELDAIIINAAGCGAALKEYTAWFKDEPEWAARAKKFCDKVKDVSEFLAQPPYKNRLQELMPDAKSKVQSPKSKAHDVVRETMPNTIGASTLNAVNGFPGSATDDAIAATNVNQQISPDQATDGKRPHDPYQKPSSLRSPNSAIRNRMTYHDACHLAHGQGVRTQPRELVTMSAQSAGEEVVPLGESEMCCGSAGIYNITQPEMAMQLLQRKMKHIAATGAKTVVSANPGCTMQLKLGAQKFGPNVEVLHPVEVLDKATGQ